MAKNGKSSQIKRRSNSKMLLMLKWKNGNLFSMLTLRNGESQKERNTKSVLRNLMTLNDPEMTLILFYYCKFYLKFFVCTLSHLYYLFSFFIFHFSLLVFILIMFELYFINFIHKRISLINTFTSLMNSFYYISIIFFITYMI